MTGAGPVLTVALIALLIATLLVAVGALLLAAAARGRVAHVADANALLETRLQTVLEQSRLELLTMGQRIIELEKQLRRVDDRLEALEAARAPAGRYGQLDPRLARRPASESSSTESTAEAALRSMLQRGGQGPDTNC